MKLTKSDPVSSTKAILAFVILVLALGILVIFNNYKDNIFDSNSFQPFMLLTIIFMGFLLSLLYFASQTTARKAKSARMVKAVKGKKKKR